MAENSEDAKTVFKTGFVSVVGGPNVGKSTLVNALVGAKVCAASPKPNTTRDRINGIFTDSESQIVFTDTPGIVRPEGKAGEKMAAAALGAIGDALTLAVTDASFPFRGGEVRAIEKSRRPAVVALNKIDIAGGSAVVEGLKKSAGFGEKISDIVPVSALKRKGLDRLLGVLKKRLPEGDRIFPEQVFTDQTEEFAVAEFIREKVFRLAHREIPYGCGVSVRRMRKGKGGTLYINAEITVEREAHAKIVVGKGGAVIKKIGIRARKDIETFLQTKVFLELEVKTAPPNP